MEVSRNVFLKPSIVQNLTHHQGERRRFSRLLPDRTLHGLSVEIFFFFTKLPLHLLHHLVPIANQHDLTPPAFFLLLNSFIMFVFSIPLSAPVSHVCFFLFKAVARIRRERRGRRAEGGGAQVDRSLRQHLCEIYCLQTQMVGRL